MLQATVRVPPPENEPVLGYLPDSAERKGLKSALAEMARHTLDIPLIIAGKRVTSTSALPVRMPHLRSKVLANVHQADAAQVEAAIAAALAAKRDWAEMPFAERAAIFLRAAELLSGPMRAEVNGATMLGQSKTAYQAEIDSACEAIDFLRFNVHFAQNILAEQPESAKGTWNISDYRPLDGFVLAVAPFNFTSIALNLCTAPALMGNVVVFKPAHTASLSAYWLMELLERAGLPPGVINFVPGAGETIGSVSLASTHLGGIHFTGSTLTFRHLWRQVGENLERYQQYPRLVGETGGKDFIFAHPSAEGDVDALAVAILRGGFEYQGQKCSACSRVYVPKSLWGKLRPRLLQMVSEIKTGDISDFRNFMGAVIDEAAFARAKGYIEGVKGSSDASLLAGGKCDDSEGYFVSPTLVEVKNPRHRVMCEEIFAPIVALYVYPDTEYEETLRLCDESTPYALTGAIFARDRGAISQASRLLRHAAGNFYINDKPTGAVVGQQPFGGGRASGTNDKAGSPLNLLRWTSPRTVKENFAPPTAWPYPFMAAE